MTRANIHVLDLCCGLDGRRRLPSACPAFTVPEQPFAGGKRPLSVTHIRDVGPHDTAVDDRLKVVFAELDRFVVVVLCDVWAQEACDSVNVFEGMPFRPARSKSSFVVTLPESIYWRQIRSFLTMAGRILMSCSICASRLLPSPTNLTPSLCCTPGLHLIAGGERMTMRLGH